MNAVSSRKKIVIVSTVFILLAGIGLGAFFLYQKHIQELNEQLNQTEYITPITFPDGFTPKIHIPKGSLFIRESGSRIVKFRTTLSESEINSFYENAYPDLKNVYYIYDSSYVSCYDAEERLVFGELSYMQDGEYAYFLIPYEAYDEASWKLDPADTHSSLSQ